MTLQSIESFSLGQYSGVSPAAGRTADFLLHHPLIEEEVCSATLGSDLKDKVYQLASQTVLEIGVAEFVDQDQSITGADRLLKARSLRIMALIDQPGAEENPDRPARSNSRQLLASSVPLELMEISLGTTARMLGISRDANIAHFKNPYRDPNSSVAENPDLRRLLGEHGANLSYLARILLSRSFKLKHISVDEPPLPARINEIERNNKLFKGVYAHGFLLLAGEPLPVAINALHAARADMVRGNTYGRIEAAVNIQRALKSLAAAVKQEDFTKTAGIVRSAKLAPALKLIPAVVSRKRATSHIATSI